MNYKQMLSIFISICICAKLHDLFQLPSSTTKSCPRLTKTSIQALIMVTFSRSRFQQTQYPVNHIIISHFMQHISNRTKKRTKKNHNYTNCTIPFNKHMILSISHLTSQLTSTVHNTVIDFTTTIHPNMECRPRYTHTKKRFIHFKLTTFKIDRQMNWLFATEILFTLATSGTSPAIESTFTIPIIDSLIRRNEQNLLLNQYPLRVETRPTFVYLFG